jgi:hypothetical protein
VSDSDFYDDMERQFREVLKSPDVTAAAFRSMLDNRGRGVATYTYFESLLAPDRGHYWGGFEWCDEMLLGFELRPAYTWQPDEDPDARWALFLPEGASRPPLPVYLDEIPRYRLVVLQPAQGDEWRVWSLGDEANRYGPHGRNGNAP